MNPADQARQAQLYQQLASVPPELRAFIASEAVKTQKSVLPVPYWSTVRLLSSRAAGPPVVLTIDTTPRKAFQYAIGGDMQVAGFAAASSATPAETNLLRAGETLDNADVWLWGLAAELCTNAEPLIAAQAWRDSLVELSLNGTQSIRLGTLAMFPAAGGLYGLGRSFVAEPQLAQSGGVDGGQGATVGYLANGNPMAGNFMRFPQPFLWNGTGRGADASLSIIVTPQRTMTFTCAVARAAAAGVAAYTPPAAAGNAGTFVDIRFRLVAVAIGARSKNV
jgi:hypothetical protein